MTFSFLNPVILSEVAVHEVNGNAVEGPRACVQHHGRQPEFSPGHLVPLP